MEDLTTLLKRDHRRVAGLLDELAEAEESEREQLIDAIESEFETHAMLEEHYIYPHVVEELGEEQNEEAHTEHDLAREGIERMRSMYSQPGFGAIVEMVKAGIHHHVQEEERELLPQLKKAMGTQAWRELSEEVGQQHENANADAMAGAGAGAGRKNGSRRAGTTRAKATKQPAKKAARRRSA